MSDKTPMRKWRHLEETEASPFDAASLDMRGIDNLGTFIHMGLAKSYRELAARDGVTLPDLLAQGITITLRTTATGNVEIDAGGYYQPPSP